MTPEEIRAFIERLRGGRGEGMVTEYRDSVMLEKFEGEGTAGKTPVETLRFEGGVLVEHLKHGVPQPLPQAFDAEMTNAHDPDFPRPAVSTDSRDG